MIIQIIKKLFKNNWTKWYPFSNYQYGFDDYIVMIKKNHKTGKLKFKTVSIQKGSSTSNINFRINSKDVFDMIMELEPEEGKTNNKSH